MEEQFTEDLGREVFVRPDTSDRQVWADTFTGRYHLPPSFMPTPSTVLDLGANIGLTAAHYRTLWPDAQIVAVEMDAACCALIAQNAPGATIRCHAVAGEAGIGTYDPGLLAEAFRFQPGAHEGMETAALTLQETVTAAFADTVDFVKMDIEGAEWGIFERGADWSPLVSRILVELHPHDGFLNDSDLLVWEARRLLVGRGYRTMRHRPHPRAVYAWRT